MFRFLKKIFKAPAESSSKLSDQAKKNINAVFEANAKDPSGINLLEGAIASLSLGMDEFLPGLLKQLLESNVYVLSNLPDDPKGCIVLSSDSQPPFVAMFTSESRTIRAKEMFPEHKFSVAVKFPDFIAGLSRDVGIILNPFVDGLLYPLTPQQIRGFQRYLVGDLKEGVLLAYPVESGRHSVCKLLKIDENGVHLRTYSNQFSEFPNHVDENVLYMKGPDNRNRNEETLGMGHLPISFGSFLSWKAKPIQASAVKDEELEGYRMWAEARGGYF